MSKFFKSLLLLLSAGVFATTGWAAELVIPYSFDGKTGNTEYAYEYQVVMPDTALTSFTTTIRYAGGSHRVEIISVKLLDGETTYTAEATGTDGNEVVEAGASYSGGNNYHNVYTFTNGEGFTANKVYTLQANLKVTNANPSHNGNIKVSGGITLDVEPFSFGVNFKTADAQNISTTTGAGFAKGDYAAPINWANYTADGGNHATYTIDATAIDVSWVACGSYNSGCSTDTDAGKLLYGYLDDAANNSRTKATVTISGLPENKKYAVALVLSGDGNGEANFNNRFSPVWINNEVYAYSETTLVKGDEAKEIEYWGSRAASVAAAGLVEGTNVMFVEGLSGGAISITSAMDDSNVSRLTIAGVQVWVTDEVAEAPAAPEDKETISLNFYSSQGSVSGAAGLVAADGWNNLGNSGSESALNVWTGEKAVSYPMALTYSSNNGYQWTGATDAFLKGYLDDGGNHAQVSLTGIPFEEYSVIVYAATDTASRKFRSVTINGQAYIGTPGATTLGYALPVYNNTHARYGASHALTAAYGTNALRVDGLSGDLTIAGGANEFSARGGIAAIQIINTGTALPDAQIIDWTAQPAEQLKTSALPELTNVSVQLKLADGVTLEMDSDITGHTIEIVGNNVTVDVTNLEISQAAAQAIFPGATVTTAYTETIGYTKDDVTYSLVYRGGMDGWTELSNWYIGTRTNDSETYWIPYTGTVVPGAPDSNKWDVGLIDGDLIGDKITADEDGYKVVNTPTLEGWALTITITNGVHIKVPTLKKLQGDCVINVDATSKMTVTNKGSGNNGTANTYNIDAEEGLVFENMAMPGGTAYLGLNGSITTGTFASQQTIGGVTLDLGDSTLTGRTVVTRTLYTYTSGTTFSVAENAVTTSEESVTAEATDILQAVGQYKFETTADGYCVSYVAYAENDEIGEVSTWTAREDTTWATEGNWTVGVPTAGADAVISITADTTITIPEAGVTVGTLVVNGEGTLTIAGGKITATKILAEANIAADETTLALAEMDIAEDKTVTYTTTTTVASLDQFNDSHALALKALTGEGTLVKKGVGVIALFNTKAETAIDVQQGAIYVRNVPTTAMNIAAKAGAEIRLAAWHVDFNNNANSLKLEGGAQLTLANGSGLAGTITIAEAAETPAKICGSSFNASTISAAITGAGKVEFADGGTFGEGAYPCDNATTYSGMISGDLQVIISDTSAVTFTGANTYTGGTVIAEGVTVTVSNLTSIFGTGAITGAGTVKIAGGTYDGLSFAQYTDANTTIEIPADNTVTGYFNSATWTCAAKIQLDGTLSLTNGFGASRYTFTGPWTGAGSFSLSNANPADAVRITGDISGFTGNLSVAGARAITFCAATTGADQKYSGKICVHGDYAYTAKVNGTWSAPVVVENGAKIGGTGSIDNTLTFANGAIIDGSVTATGDVTLPATGTVTVSGEAGATVLTCANAESLDLTKFTAPDGLKCIAEDGAVKLAVANPEFIATVPAGGTLTLSGALGDTELAANTILIIDFGSEGGEAGTFTFNNEEAITLTSITVTGTNGGTIAKAEGAEIAYGTLVLNTTVAADAAFYAENTGAIEGTGKLCLASGELTFSGANTYTGGTDIATGATLTITNADAIGTGAITGAGTLACDGFMPTNKTGLTDAENWTGTLALVSTPEQTDIAFNSLGNASSTVRLQDYTGSLSNKTAATCYTPNLEIKGTNTINAATEYAIPIFQGDVSGDGTIVFSANKNTNYLFSGDFSAFTGTMELTHESPKIAIGAASNTTWNAWNPIVNSGQGNITIATAATLNGTFRAVNGVETTSSAILSGNGTIDSALTLAADATIDASATLLTVTGDITLPNTLTVKIAAAPTDVTPVSILTTTTTPNVANTTVTVIVNDETLEGNFEFVKNGDKLQVRVAPERIAASETPVSVTEVPSAIFLDTATFGYGTHTVLQYTGGTTDWAGMSVEGLPDGAEIITTDTTWGFAIKTLNVLTVGDSITAGLVTYHNSSANWHVPGGYRLPLYKYLTRAGYSVKYLGSSDVFGTSSVGGNNANEANPSPSLGENDHHEGHSGITLDTMISRFGEAEANVKAVIASQGTPDVITLHLGTNDMQNQAQDTDDSVGNQFDEMKKLIYRLNGVCDTSATDDWKAEIGTPLYPNATIFVAKIIPRGDEANQAKVDKFNKLLEPYVTGCNSGKLILVTLPMGEGTSYGYYRHDYLHPSTEGYAQMAKGWFDAIDAAFDPFGETTAAPTPVDSTPTTDVTEEDPATIGIRNSTANTIGPFKAAEWTTFTDFETGYLSQFGYMPDAERPWQLDVRGENAPTVTDGVLSLNGAPITVNPVDGRLGTTLSTYTIVMKVSDLAANDVIFTDSSVECTDWPSAKGTTNADLGKLTVVDADTLAWSYKDSAATEITLEGANLTDTTPDVIAITVANNQCKVAVNGGTAVTVTSGSAIGETYRGSWSIGALSTAETGSSMKLYRLSFYEGAATVTMPATEYVIPVGTYDTWSEAVAGLNITDTTLPVTINFTAADQTFTFDETVTIDAVTVQGEAGTIAKDGDATVTVADLDVTTSVKMEDDAMALTGDVNVAADCVLTYNVGDGMTVNATHTGSGSIAVTNAGVYNGGMLEITKTCSVNVAVNASASLVVNVDPAFNGDNFTKALADNVTVSGAGAVVLQQGIAYANFDVAGVDVVGTYYLGIGGTAQNPIGSFTPDALYVGEDAALKVRAYRDYSLTVNAVYVEGVIEKDGGNVTPTMTVTADGGVTSYSGEGQINLTLILEEGVLLEGATGLTVQNLQLPNTLKIAESALPSAETPVVLFKTTAFADAQGQVEGVTLMVNDQATEDYLLYKTAEALELRYAPWTTVTEVTASGDVDSWSELLATITANRQNFDAATGTLIINFGDADGEAVPGTFTFDLDDATALTLAAVQIQGTNGGTIAKEGEGVSVSVGATSIAENVAVNVTAGAMELGTTTIAAGAEVTLNDTAALGTTDAASVANKVTGAGTLVLNGVLPAGLANGSAGKLVAEDWTGTVKVVNVDNRNLDLGDLVRSDSSLVLNNVKAYIYDCAMASLTLEGDFQQNNGTSERPKTQCVTIDTLTGSGALIGPDNAPYCTAYNVKAVESFTGAIDLSHENSKNTIFFFGVAPDRFTTSITEGNVGANDADFTDEDYGTLYTNIALTVPAGKTWAVKGVVVEAGGSLAIEGWCDPGSRLVQNNPGAATVENGGVLDLRGLDNLSGISVTVKTGGRVLVKSGATVPDSIVFETGAILGICPASVDDIGSATLTVTASGTAKSTATKKGYKTDGVTELEGWTDKGAQDNTLSFGYDPIFDGELCWWAYEFDEDENTTTDSTDGPDNTGRDKTSLVFDGSGSTGRILVGQEYVTNGDGTKALRLAAAPYRGVSPSYPTAFTATVYGKLTSQLKTILLGFGSTYDSKDTIALVTGASPNEVNLVWVKGHEGDNGDYPENCVTTLATTTVPNGTTENHLFGFSYELKDTDEDGTNDTTEIIFYVDGDKYQPYKVNKVLTLGDGFQAGSFHGGWPRNGKAPTASDWLYRMGDNDADKAATIEFLRVYDEVLPEETFTAMANAYPYISKVGRATRTIVAGADSTWHEAGEWSQVKVVDGVAQDPVNQDNPDYGTTAEPEIGTQVFLNVDGENTLYLNEFYSTTTDPESGETTTDGNSKLYYERLEINGVAGGDEDSLTMWAGRLNPAIEEEDPLKNSQSAVLTVLGYTKINTNVTFAHNVAYLSGPVAVAEGKYLHFDFSGFDVMKVPSMPVTYRLTGFLDEETRTRVTSTAPAEPVNARSIDLGYKTDVNQYTFKVDRYPVTAYFTEDEMAAGNSTEVNFNNLNYVWQGNDLGKQMNWEAEAVDPQGNHIIENTLAKFVSLDSETQQEKIVTVTLATNDAEPVTLTLAESALSKETSPDVVEPMLGAEQLIVGNNVIVDYTGDDAGELAPYVKEAVGMVKAKAMTATTWRGNLTLDNGEGTVEIAGANTISGKLVLGKSITLATGTTISAKDADFTAVEAITVDYEEAVAAGTYKVVGLEAGHTAKSLIGCVVTAVKDDTSTVEWTEAEGTLVVVRADGLYVVARPDVKAGETVIATNDGLTLPLARRAAELSATSVSLTGVVNMAGDPVDAPVADAAEVFTNVAFDMNETVVDGVVTAKLKYDFGVSDIAVVTIGGTQYVVAELIVSNNTKLDQNTAGYADGTTIDVSVKVGDAAQDVTVEAAADMTGATVSPAAELPASTRYIRFQMPTGNGTFEIKARASKSALP